MYTLEELIADVLDRMVRPDLLPSARKLSRSVLFNAHALSDFHRDIVRTATTAVSGDATSIALPSNYRKLHGVLSYDVNGTRLNVKYTPAVLGQPESYFGVSGLQASYYLIGGACSLKHSYPLPFSVQLEYYALPAFTQALDGSVSTDSWMLDAHYEYVVLALMYQLAAVVTNNRDAMALIAPSLNTERILLLANQQAGG